MVLFSQSAGRVLFRIKGFSFRDLFTAARFSALRLSVCPKGVKEAAWASRKKARWPRGRQQAGADA